MDTVASSFEVHGSFKFLGHNKHLKNWAVLQLLKQVIFYSYFLGVECADSLGFHFVDLTFMNLVHLQVEMWHLNASKEREKKV